MSTIADTMRAIARTNIIRDELELRLVFVRRDMPSPIFEAMLDNMAAAQYAGECRLAAGTL